MQTSMKAVAKVMATPTIKAADKAVSPAINPEVERSLDEVLELLQNNREQILEIGRKTDMPIFTMDVQAFMGLGGSNPELAGFNGPKKLFGKVNRFYVHGTLEEEMGYDICSFAAGNFQDKVLQVAGLVDEDGKLHLAVITMVTSDRGGKYAFLVSPEREQIVRALNWLYDGEWLRQGKERF